MKTAKKTLDITSYINKTLKDTVYSLCTAVNETYCVDADKDAEICLTISDIDNNVLYKETSSVVKKVCSKDNLKQTKSAFYKRMDDILLKRRINIEIDKLIVSEIKVQVCKVRFKEEKYVKVEIIVDGNPTLAEALEYMIDHNLTTCEVVINDTKSKHMSVFIFTMNISDREHINRIFSEEILNTNLSKYPTYTENNCKFFIRL